MCDVLRYGAPIPIYFDSVSALTPIPVFLPPPPIFACDLKRVCQCLELETLPSNLPCFSSIIACVIETPAIENRCSFVVRLYFGELKIILGAHGGELISPPPFRDFFTPVACS